ncbi:UDP-N-acetylmuramate dehydrogenase [Demequina maris]|uniref:UDP-N-acetylmuramate dehydrogenase n=1 Tax=Demequina maris TaxID=1638982 RepID=UPI0007859E28|nr:UDP-N-acetylmuramate dehydrogenase [Demequina maris]
MNEHTIDALRERDDIEVATDVDLSALTRWRVGGPAAALVSPRTPEAAAEALRLLAEGGVPVCVIGETSNLLFDSAGLDAALVRIGANLAAYEIDGTRVRAQGGVPVPTLARAVGAHGLTGIEHTCGVPGTLAGLVAMNGGTMRRGIGENVTRVRVARPDGTLAWVDREDCGFSYRRSAFQDAGVAIVEVELELAPGDRAAIEEQMDQIVASRKARFPEDQPNCGSTFLSDPKMYAEVGPPGAVIEKAGFKGRRRGGAQVSDQHANFINNIGGATSADILGLIAEIRDTVQRATGHLLECEARYVGPDGRIVPAHVAADRALAAAPATEA